MLKIKDSDKVELDMNKFENPIRCPTCNKILKNKPYEYNGYCCYACWKKWKKTKDI